MSTGNACPLGRTSQAFKASRMFVSVEIPMATINWSCCCCFSIAIKINEVWRKSTYLRYLWSGSHLERPGNWGTFCVTVVRIIYWQQFKKMCRRELISRIFFFLCLFVFDKVLVLMCLIVFIWESLSNPYATEETSIAVTDWLGFISAIHL